MKGEEKMERQFVRSFRVVKAFQGMAVGWFFSTYTLFLLGHGLSLFQANLLNMWFMLVGLLLNPPTGYLADKIGKKRVYWFGLVFWGMGMLIYGLGHFWPLFLVGKGGLAGLVGLAIIPNALRHWLEHNIGEFWVFFLAEGIGAIGSAMMSDALESWLRNNVAREVADRVAGSSKAIEVIAQIPSTLLGSLIAARYGLQWPWFCSAISSAGALLLSWVALRSLPEGKSTSVGKVEFPKMGKILRQTWQNPFLRLSAIVAFGANAAFQPFNMFWAPILREATGGETWWFGSLWVGVAGLTALGSYLAVRVHRQGRKEMGITLASIGLPMIFPAIFPGKMGVILIGFLLHEAGRGAIVTLLANYNNRYIGDQTRATQNSTLSSIAGFGRMVGLGISGALTLVLLPLQVWGISALALILLSIYVWRRK